MPDLVKLAPGALAVGQALPWTVYDEGGNLLVRKGYVVHSERQLERLYERGLCYAVKTVLNKPLAEDEPPVTRISPFVEYPTLLRDLKATIAAILGQESDAQRRVLSVAQRIDSLCTSDPDACLALVHLNAREPSAYEQTLFHVVLCRLIAGRLELETHRTMLLLAAALTANIALLRHLDKLNSSNRELTEPQRVIIRKHPLLSASAMAQAGFVDKTLLRVIEQHHEQFDGSGYPAGCPGADIILEAKILALAERYTAMISPRAYRKRYRADRAMGEILASTARDPDQSVYHALVRELTPYPPGVVVRLGSGELAVITHRPVAGEAHLAQAIVSSNGNPYMGAFFRDCEEHQVAGIVVPESLPAFNPGTLWGYI